MRTHIAKSLQTRCKAIRNAVRAYNSAAQALVPPRPTLEWSRVSHYTFLDEFNLLRDTRQDIQQKPWADLAIRETIKQNLRLKRAREELLNCNIEIRRLHTSIVDEHSFFEALLPQCKASGNPIYGAVEEYILRRRGVNHQILARISQTYALKGFTGDPTPGVRKGTEQADSMDVDASQTLEANEMARQLDADDDEPDGDLDEDDEGADEIGGLVDYISNLTLTK
jgi:hypothetical protein